MNAALQQDATSADLYRDAREVVRIWYEARLNYGRVIYEPIKQRQAAVPQDVPDDELRDPDPLATAKRDRPENWNTTTVRQVIGPDGKPAVNYKGEPIVETVPVEHGPKPASGTETRQTSKAKVPRGISMEYTHSARTPATVPGSLLSWINAVMLRMSLVDPAAADTVEMWAAGYSQRKMASVLGVSKAKVATILDAVFFALQLALVLKPKPELSRGPYRRHTLRADIFRTPQVNEYIRETLTPKQLSATTELEDGRNEY